MAHCKHGEFDVEKGCPQCVAARQQKGVAPGLASESAITLRPGEDIEVRDYYADAVRLLDSAHCKVIATAEDLKAATTGLSNIARLKKLMDGKRKEYLAPLKAQTEAIRETYNLLMTPILEADKITRDKMLAYNAEQARIRQAQEEINRKRLEAAEAEIKLKGELSKVVNLVPVAPEAPTAIKTNVGTAGQRDNWKYEVTDFSALPDEYKLADTAMLNSIAKRSHDQKQVPGVRFYNEPIISVRAR